MDAKTIELIKNTNISLQAQLVKEQEDYRILSEKLKKCEGERDAYFGMLKMLVDDPKAFNEALSQSSAAKSE